MKFKEMLQIRSAYCLIGFTSTAIKFTGPNSPLSGRKLRRLTGKLSLKCRIHIENFSNCYPPTFLHKGTHIIMLNDVISTRLNPNA